MNTENKETPLAYDVYQKIAEEYASIIDTKDANVFYEKPAMLSLMPMVKGKYILDAGCGPGVYTEWLLESEAKVLGLDCSERMVVLAKKRIQERCDIKVADLSKPLDLPNDTFDMVLAPLVFDYIDDWRLMLKELNRVLKDRGIILFSCGHPCFDFHRYGTENYFKTELVKDVWSSGFKEKIEMPFFRRSLSEKISSLVDSGFLVDRILEPQPAKNLKKDEFYEKLLKSPLFICIRAIKNTR